LLRGCCDRRAASNIAIDPPGRLKKAYRQKALQLHPDRNYGDVERTTALFAEVRAAYEVLSDAQERAWYDAHEGDILRGGTGEAATEDHYQGTMRMTTADELARIMGRFRGNVDYSDSPNGFFGFVRDTFAQLAKEDEYAAAYNGGGDVPIYPTFGHKDDSYDDIVRTFYATWARFATAKSFAWLDRYRLSDAPDRRTRRLMEKENLKFREDGRREFNAAVHTLVAFVRKRDPRYTPLAQSDEAKAKTQRDARTAQAARARAAQLAKLEQESQTLPSWATVRPADELQDESEQESEQELYECVACNKTFKSERQYEAHEKSKKHQKAVQSLQEKMQNDHVQLELDDDAVDSGIPPAQDEPGVDNIEGHLEDLTERTVELEVDDCSTDVTADERPTQGVFTPELCVGHTPRPGGIASVEDDSEYGGGHASQSETEARSNGLAIAQPFAAPEISPCARSTKSTEPDTEPDTKGSITLKVGKAAQKRAKKAAKQVDLEQSRAKQKCLGCDATFPSKNQLFDHLQDHPKHAAFKQGMRKKGKKR